MSSISTAIVAQATAKTSRRIVQDSLSLYVGGASLPLDAGLLVGKPIHCWACGYVYAGVHVCLLCEMLV